MTENITLYADPTYPDEYWEELQDIIEARFGKYTSADFDNPSADEESACYDLED